SPLPMSLPSIIYTLSLHDALPIFPACGRESRCRYSLLHAHVLRGAGATSLRFHWWFAQLELFSCQQLPRSLDLFQYGSHRIEHFSRLLGRSHSDANTPFAARIGGPVADQNSCFSHALHKHVFTVAKTSKHEVRVTAPIGNMQCAQFLFQERAALLDFFCIPSDVLMIGEGDGQAHQSNLVHVV